MSKVSYIIIIFLFLLSLVATDKMVSYLKLKDPIMLEIMNNNSSESINAVINNDEIIPGISSCIVDENKSYKNMKIVNEYNSDLLIFNSLLPDISLNNTYDKYIISGNSVKREVSVVIYIKSNISILDNIDTKVNVFLNSDLLSNDILKLNSNIRVYNGGNDLIYDKVVVDWMNDVIIDTYNDSNYCINLDKNKSNLDICARNKMYTIKPVKYNNITDLKRSINNGSIIYFDEDNICYFDNVMNYINSRDYKVVYLDELLDENMC